MTSIDVNFRKTLIWLKEIRTHKIKNEDHLDENNVNNF